MACKVRPQHLTIYIWILWAVPATLGVIPEYSLSRGAVKLTGVDGTNPIIYDNDWWFDVFDNNYLWAQTSLGQANLVGSIVSRDMWDWEKGYLYPMQRCVDDARKAIALARTSGLRDIPDATLGSDRVLNAPASGRIEDTVAYPSDGSRLIVREAQKASPDKPLVIIAGGPLTTVANALVTDPNMGPNIVVFSLTVSYYGYNGKDGWSAYIVAKRARLVEWATQAFWERGSVFQPQHFVDLPDNPFCNEMRAFIKTNLGMANQLGDGAPLVWLYDSACWTAARTRKAVWKGKAVDFVASPEGDVLDIPRSHTDLDRCRKEFFRVLENPKVYGPAVAQRKTRVVVLTDISGDPDDKQSLVRFLAYANEFDVEGLIATTSCWKQNNPDIGAIRQVIDAYGKVRPNLHIHAPGYPTAETLKSVTKRGVDGYGMSEAARQLDNEGIEHIISVVDREDPRPVWILSWGGSNTLGGAVMKVVNTRSAARAQAFVRKIRGYEIALQDDGHAYIAHHFPHAKLISSRVQWKGMSRTTPTFNAWSESWGGNNDVFTHDWIKTNIQESHGPLGRAYPKAVYLWEGDTPAFLYLIPNGLGSPEHPHYGCWGGRFKMAANIRSGTGNDTVDPRLDTYRDYHVYSDARDTWIYKGTTYAENEYAPIFRWREAFQNDFSARMDWCVADDVRQANHNPIAILNGDDSQDIVELTGKPGTPLTLSSAGSTDPDGDTLTSHWMVYPESGTFVGEATLSHGNGTETALTIPEPGRNSAANPTIHVILTVKDNGTPYLVAYRRAIVTLK